MRTSLKVYKSAADAWECVTATCLSNSRKYAGNIFDDPGWIKGTKSDYGSYGAYLWMKKSFCAFCAFLWLSFFSFTTSEAGTFTNWPTYASGPLTNWPKASEYDKLVQDFTWTHNALLERCAVTGVSTNNIGPASGGTRRPKDNIQRFKNKAEELIGHFVNTSKADANGTFNVYFSTPDAASNYPSSFPMLTVTGVLAEANLPSDYFDYTPLRCLNGTGPSGYPTDYGWKYFDSIINHLIWTKKGTRILENRDFYSFGETNIWYSTNWCESGWTWAECVAAQTELVPCYNSEDWPGIWSNEEQYPGVWYKGLRLAGTNFLALPYKVYAYWKDSLPTNLPGCDYDLYLRNQTNWIAIVFSGSRLTFDSNDCSVAEYPIYKTWISTNLSTSRTNEDFYILVGPDTNTLSEIPNVCDEPTDFLGETRGWSLGYHEWYGGDYRGYVGQLFKWDGTNGFQYK